MKKLLLLLAGVMLFPCLTFAEDIKTVDGTVYKNVSIEGLNPSGIDIGYTDDNGNYILRGLAFATLPENIQKRFGYKPEVSRQFDAKVNKYSSAEMEDVANTEKSRLETIKKEVKQKLAGADINISPADLRYAVFALRRLVKIKSAGPIRQGCVVDIQEITSGKPIKSKRVLLDGVNLPPDNIWTGYIYPTGAQATYQNVNGIPVFTESVNRSVDIINKYLNIYGEYAASMKDQENAPPQDIPAPDQDNNDNTAASSDYSNTLSSASSPTDSSSYNADNSRQDQQMPLDNNFNYTPDDGYGYSYSFGGSYYPVDWYWRHHNRPHPHPKPGPPPGPKPVYDANNFNSRERAYEQSLNRQAPRPGSIPNAGGGQRNYEQLSNRVGNFHQAYSGGGRAGGGGRR
jgi:hypothetical protein